jgi:general secretion pathway protein A
MYIDYYGLQNEPFHITPDPARIFLSPGHKDAIGTILYGLGARKGFMAVTGDAGAGKTTVLRYCLASLPKTYDVVYVLQPALPPSELLCLIYRELVGKRASRRLLDRADGISEIVAAIHAHLFKVFDQGRSVVIVIDEAQNMPIQTLESLRVLSNLETDTEKLLQIVLVGQSELNEKLARHEMRQLDQRIAVRTHIPALTQAEAQRYIEHRLALAGRTTTELFTRQAVSVILRAANGNARRLNVLCDNALMNGFGHNAPLVTRQIAREVSDQLRDQSRRRFSLGRWLFAPAIALFGWMVTKKDSPTAPVADAAMTATLPAKRNPVRKRPRRSKPRKAPPDVPGDSVTQPDSENDKILPVTSDAVSKPRPEA